MWHGVVKSLRSNILVGLVLVTPLVITLWIVNFLFTYLTNYIVPRHWLLTEWSVLYRLAALILVLIALYLTGLLTRNFIGKRLYRFGESIVTRIPIIKTIYLSIRQVSESMFNSRRTLFKQVVAVEFPRKGIYSLGFVTSYLHADMTAKLAAGAEKKWSETICILVPTSPNPTTGFFMLVPREDLVFLDISVTDAMKMLISAGTLIPGPKGEIEKTLLERLEEWLHSDIPEKHV